MCVYESKSGNNNNLNTYTHIPFRFCYFIFRVAAAFLMRWHFIKYTHMYVAAAAVILVGCLTCTLYIA